MATATMATAAGAAALLYYTLNRKLTADVSEIDDENGDDAVTGSSSRIERVSHRLIQAPATWLETISTLSETLRFTYSETLGKWPIGDLAFGINFLLKRQGNLQVDRVFGGNESLPLNGVEIIAELRYLLYLLTLCWHFSKKPFPLFLEETGYAEESVLLQEPKAGILKPAFTVLVDHRNKYFLLLIRGTHSIKDTLTAVTGAVVPFHHTVVHDGGVSNLVLGYAHGGMVAAARWIAKLATPCLLKALGQHPGYNIKIVGHSLGGGTAALLTYVLREQKELSAATCVAFAPAACMTWDLAESGNDFITTVINGADLVPSFSAASVDDLRAEVTASAWVNDLRNQIEQTRILSTVFRSATALGSRLPSIASAKARVAGAGAILRPVSNGTQVVMRRAQSMLTRPSLSSLSSWSCIGPRRRAAAAYSNSKDDEFLNPQDSQSANKTETSESLLVSHEETTELEFPRSEVTGSRLGALDLDEGDDPTDHDSPEARMTEAELWQQLEQDLDHSLEIEDADMAEEIKKEEEEEEEEEEEVEEEAAAMVGGAQPENLAPEMKEARRFFPAGRIMHIFTVSSSESDETSHERVEGEEKQEEDKVGIYLTQRSLYSKIRLSQAMIRDHLMPVYRRQIERLIRELEEEQDSGNS